ncbi:MAG: Ig-like domain-containing protein [Caldilineaceae bacterium]
MLVLAAFSLPIASAQSTQSVLLVLSAPELDEYAGFTHAVRDDGIVSAFQQQLTWPAQTGSYFEYGYLASTRAYDLLAEKTPPQKLVLLLGAAPGEAIELALAYGAMPTQVTQDGNLLTPVNSLSGLSASTVSTYYYDATLGKLYLKLFGAAQEQLFRVESTGNTGGGSLGPVGRAPNPVNSVAPGLYYEYYEISGNLESQTPVQTGVVANFDLAPRQRDADYAFRFIGYVNIPAEAIYTITLRADSDSRVLLSAAPLLIHSGDPFTPTETSQVVALQPGFHHLVVEYMHVNNVLHELSLSWESNTMAMQPIPAARLFFPTSGTTILPTPNADLTPTATITPTVTLTTTPVPTAIPSATPTGVPNGNSAHRLHLPLVRNGERTGNQPPTVSLTQPLANELFDTTDIITLTAIAADDDRVVGVGFYADNQLLGEDAEAPYAFGWQNAPAGIHQLTALALDNDGSSTTSAAVSITVAQAADTESRVFFSEPVNGATVTETVPVKMGAANFTIEPAGGVQLNAGHFHIMIDTPVSPWAKQFRATMPICTSARVKVRLCSC